MTLPTKENLLHLGVSPVLADEYELQFVALQGPNVFTGGNQDFTGVTGTMTFPVATNQCFGGGAGTGTANSFVRGSGVMFRINSAAATGFAGNAADTTDDILTGIQLPASVFDVGGRGLRIVVRGKTASNTNNKRAKVFLNPTMSGQSLIGSSYANQGTVTGGGTVIADTGAWVNATTPNSNVGWELECTFFKYGNAGSNTQNAQYTTILGATHGGISLPVACTATESAVINLVVTGSSYTTGAANDVMASLFYVEAFN